MAARIVVTHYRYKPPPPRKKGEAREPMPTVVVHIPTAKPPAASKRAAKAETSVPAPRRVPPLLTIVVATNQKRLKRLRTELRMAQPGEPSPEVDAFFATCARVGRCRLGEKPDAASPERQAFARLQPAAAGSPAWRRLHRPQAAGIGYRIRNPCRRHGLRGRR